MSDLISRAEAIAWVENILTVDKYYHPHAKSRNVPIDEVIDRLSQVPSVEPKTGEWKEVQSYGDSPNSAICECSVCGDTVWVYTGKRAWNYCPNCGAKMENCHE